MLTQIVLTDIRCKALMAQNSREVLREQILAKKQSASMERARTLQAELSALDRRLADLEKLIQAAMRIRSWGGSRKRSAFSF